MTGKINIMDRLEDVEATVDRMHHRMTDDSDADLVEDLFERIKSLEIAMEDANSICRSMHSIATRKGRETNWEYFIIKLESSLRKQKEVMGEFYAP